MGSGALVSCGACANKPDAVANDARTTRVADFHNRCSEQCRVCMAWVSEASSESRALLEARLHGGLRKETREFGGLVRTVAESAGSCAAGESVGSVRNRGGRDPGGRITGGNQGRTIPSVDGRRIEPERRADSEGGRRREGRNIWRKDGESGADGLFRGNQVKQHAQDNGTGSKQKEDLGLFPAFKLACRDPSPTVIIRTHQVAL